MLKSTAVTVGTTATRLDSATETGGYSVQGEDVGGQGIAVYNNSTVTIYIGGSDVTTTNGAPIPAASWGPSLDLAHLGEAVYGIVATGTAEARVLEVGV